jgi:hypothetical protein
MELQIENIELKPGSHESPQDGMCVMEAVSYFQGLPFTDAPQCVDPVIRGLMIRLNDRWSHEDRQRLKPYILKVVGTNEGVALSRKRAFACADFAIRTILPLVFVEEAIWFEGLPEIVDIETADLAQGLAYCAKDSAYAAYAYAAYDAAAYAYAAYAAAAYAAYAAAYAAADAAYAAKRAASVDNVGLCLALLNRLLEIK